MELHLLDFFEKNLGSRKKGCEMIQMVHEEFPWHADEILLRVYRDNEGFWCRQADFCVDLALAI